MSDVQNVKTARRPGAIKPPVLGRGQSLIHGKSILQFMPIPIVFVSFLPRKGSNPVDKPGGKPVDKPGDKPAREQEAMIKDMLQRSLHQTAMQPPLKAKAIPARKNKHWWQLWR